MNVLPVPYSSQITQGALEHNNDCGAASGLMLLQAYHLAMELTVDALYNQVQPSGDVALSAGGLQIVLAKLGLKNDWKAGMALHDLYDAMLDRKPVIALIHYAPLVKAGLSQKTGFLGAHFVVVDGLDIQNVSIHDPYRSDGRADVEIPIGIFRQCWSDACLDGNPQDAALVPRLPIQDLSKPGIIGDEYALLVNGLNLRSGPGNNDPVLRVIWKSLTPSVQISEIIGDRGRLANDSGWVFMPYLKEPSNTQRTGTSAQEVSTRA